MSELTDALLPSATQHAPSCSLHRGAAATAACERCGTFGCQDCLSFVGELRLCKPCVARQVVELPSLEGRAFWARLGVVATGGLHAASGLAALLPGANRPDELTPGLMIAVLLGLAYFPIFIVTVVMFCRWFHLCVRHAAARGMNLGITPAGAVGSWFIPFVNLVRPFDLSRRMLACMDTDERFAHNGSLVGSWQALWIVGNVASNVSVRIDAPIAELIASSLLVGAAFTCVRVINALTGTTSPRVAPA